jgi:uncharacterized protein (DUF302 family)
LRWGSSKWQIILQKEKAMTKDLGFEVRLELPYEAAVEKVTAALKVEGFGVLTRIDVKATLKEKLDQEFRPYAILGACNPPLAHRALSTDSWVGLMLPCNVTVEAEGQDRAVVRIANPEMIMQAGGLEGNETLRGVAAEARERLERVAGALQSS